MARSACIAGIGESALGQVPGGSTLQLQTDAASAALADAGLKFEDIDGLITTPVRTEAWNMPCGIVASHMGVQPAYLSTLDLAEASGAAIVTTRERARFTARSFFRVSRKPEWKKPTRRSSAYCRP